MVKRIQNTLRGNLLIEVRGAAVERFLNLCAIHGVSFWGIRTLDADYYTACVTVAGYFALRPYARKTGCRVRVLKKKGVPFTARRITRRWVLWAGLLVCVAVIWFLSGFVWTIQVDGCETVTEGEILTLLEQAGLKTGSRREKLNIRELRNSVMIQTDKLSYFTVNFQGTTAKIQVWERRHPEEQPVEPLPCDVASGLTGIISALRVKTGLAAVKVGDTVQAGDVIARGTVVNANDDTDITLLHAEAEADLRTWYTLRAAVPSELQVLVTEKSEIGRSGLLLGRQRIPLGRIEKTTLPWYDKQINTHYLTLHRDFRWTIGFLRETRLKCTGEAATVSRNALAKVLEERMRARLLAEKPEAQLVSAAFTLETSEQGAWLGVLKVELLETTGVEVPIG